MKLEKLRKQIDGIDGKLLEFLAKRLDLSKEIGRIKRGNLLPIEDKVREKEVMKKLKIKAGNFGLSYSFIVKVFRQIFAESKKIQRKNQP